MLYSIFKKMISLLEADELENLLNYLKGVLRIDLTGYRRSSLLRRVRLRMQRIDIEHYQDYLDYLQQQPDEGDHLLRTVFVNFTAFFRDRWVWNCLEQQIIPRIITNKAPDEPIRVWSAGCASGEETYSLAMLLIEALGVEQFRQRVRLYGTDADSDAILQARQGYYPRFAVEAIPAVLQQQYFERKKGGYAWRQDLRGSIQFHTHNLFQFPPLPDIDLLICRNTLMYFTPETKLRALVRFHFSLKQTGFLLLGHAENLVTPPEGLLFQPIYFPIRAFTKVPDAHRSQTLLPIAFCAPSRIRLKQTADPKVGNSVTD